METKVIIDSKVNVYYASFYIKGLYYLFGEKNIVFKSMPFKETNDEDGNLNFIVFDNKLTKYSISLDDSYLIKKKCYEWCDVYGSVNANMNETPIEYKNKLVSLAPSFGIKLWSIKNTIYFAISNYIKLNKKTNFKKFIGKYKRQYLLRLPLEMYFHTIPKKNYIFHISTLWQSDEWIDNDEFVNKKRAVFIETCKSIDKIKFEGGFYYSGNFILNERFKKLIFNDFMPISNYILKLHQTILVFNTPAWLNCNGWKLGEYLALGKAIITTSICNDLPSPLLHGINIHFVEDSEEHIKSAILYILNNDDYRIKLETGALNYWNQYCTPIKSLELLGIRNK